MVTAMRGPHIFIWDSPTAQCTVFPQLPVYHHVWLQVRTVFISEGFIHIMPLEPKQQLIDKLIKNYDTSSNTSTLKVTLISTEYLYFFLLHPIPIMWIEAFSCVKCHQTPQCSVYFRTLWRHLGNCQLCQIHSTWHHHAKGFCHAKQNS